MIKKTKKKPKTDTYCIYIQQLAQLMNENSNAKFPELQ